MSLRSEQGAVKSEWCSDAEGGQSQEAARGHQVPCGHTHLVRQYAQMSCTRSGNVSSEPSKETPERHWE